MAGDARAFADLAVEAADTAGFNGFRPDACLVNRNAPGTRLSLHQDRNERDFGQPIVSVSLGLASRLPAGRQEARRQEFSMFYWSMAMSWYGAARIV
jgi:alkylated DNA repair protein (DNA oxidative demethylase)